MPADWMRSGASTRGSTVRRRGATRQGRGSGEATSTAERDGRSAGRSGQPLREHPHVLGKLGRLVDLEVDPEHRDADGEPAKVVVAGPERAAVVVDRLD